MPEPATHIALACCAALAGLVLAPALARLARWSLGDGTAAFPSSPWVRAITATVFAACAGAVGPHWDLAAWLIFAAADGELSYLVPRVRVRFANRSAPSGLGG